MQIGLCPVPLASAADQADNLSQDTSNGAGRGQCLRSHGRLPAAQRQCLIVTLPYSKVPLDMCR